MIDWWIDWCMCVDSDWQCDWRVSRVWASIRACWVLLRWNHSETKTFRTRHVPSANRLAQVATAWWFVIVDVVELISVMLYSLPVFISDVTISKFWFSIDFDSIFSPKWRFRFDSILVTPTLNHSRQNSVCLQSDLLPLQNRPAFANWCEFARYVSADNSLPVNSDQSPTHLPFADVKMTGDNHVPTVEFNLSRTTHQQHSEKLDAWHWQSFT